MKQYWMFEVRIIFSNITLLFRHLLAAHCSMTSVGSSSLNNTLSLFIDNLTAIGSFLLFNFIAQSFYICCRTLILANQYSFTVPIEPKWNEAQMYFSSLIRGTRKSELVFFEFPINKNLRNETNWRKNIFFVSYKRLGIPFSLEIQKY